jgi:hypothetical protein
MYKAIKAALKQLNDINSDATIDYGIQQAFERAITKAEGK